jgi:hypothetical protein
MPDAKYTSPDISRIIGDTFGVHVISNSVNGLTSSTNALPTSDLLYKNEIANENVTGVRTLYKFGRNSDINGAEETIWDEGGLYVYPTSAIQMKVSSSNINDTSVGTGARTIRVIGLNSLYNEIEEDVTLNGQTAILTSNTFIRVYRAFVLTAGSSNNAQGDIYIGTGTVTAGVPATVYAKITQGENQTLMALWTVPAGYSFFLYQVDFTSAISLANTYSTTRLKFRPFNSVFRTLYINQLQSGTHVNDIVIPQLISEKSDIECTAISSGNNNPVSASIAGLYIQN